MSVNPFPDPGSEPAEPAGSAAQPAREGEDGGVSWSEDDWDGAAYIGELTAAVAAGEELTTEDIAQAGFAQGGIADQMYAQPHAGHPGSRRHH